jgi:Ca2+-binding RTX toxin-like protein
LSGSQFNDTLIGNSGNNTLFGGGGDDTFLFNKTAPGGIGHDTISDFASGQDHIKLDYLAFNRAMPVVSASGFPVMSPPRTAAAIC